MTLASFYPILAVADGGRWDLAPVGTIGDAVTSEAATYDVSVTADCGLSVLSSGRLQAEEPGEDGCWSRFAGEGIRDFMIVLGDAYDEVAQTESGVLVRASFLPGHETAGQVALARAEEAVALYGKLFGPCPYDELDLVEVPLNHAAGVEYPGLVLIGESYCGNPQDSFFDVIVAHEVAHQWWYAGVGNDVVKEPWLDEGLATFSSGLFLEHVFGESAARSAIATWQSAYRKARDEHPDLSVASPTTAFQDAATYSGFVYCGGALFLDALRRALGDALFFGVLSQYYRDETLHIAQGSDLLRRLREASPSDLTALFIEYLGPEATRSAFPFSQ